MLTSLVLSSALAVCGWSAMPVADALIPAAAPAAAPAGAPASAEARAALDAAGKVKRQSFKKQGEEKRKILQDAAGAYARVLEDHAGDAAACAEAAFRLGEIQRSLGDFGAAAAAFEKAAAQKAEPRFAARACNELGHLARRAKRAEDARKQYERVLAEHPGETGECVKALTWIGKLEEKNGDPAQARATWLSLAERFPSEAVAAVRAADLAALSALSAGAEDEAKKILADTRARFAEGPHWSPDVEEALGRMRSAKRLEGGAAAAAEADDDE